MTTPQDIQAALDKVENTFRLIAAQDQGCGGNLNPCEIYKAMQKIAIDAIAGMSEIRHVLQSHAPEASTVDVEALKKRMNNPTFDDDDEMPLEIEAYNHGWNDCIDELLRRGFRQGGGKGDVLIATLQDIKGMTDADDPESYRCDDREGCLDTVFEVASEALARCVPDDGGGV